jgi:ATP-dependent exoDNAse (exonuclease V) beta subunit
MLTVVKASAGSGKTYTLVCEYLRLALRNPSAQYKHILSITFTNKAANEMKSRILEALSKLTVLDENENALIDFLTAHLGIDKATLQARASSMLSSILHNYTDLAISTIDSFTHHVIKGFAYELKLNMNVEIEMNAKLLMSEVIDLLIDEVEESNTKDDEQTSKYLSKALIEFASTKLQEGKGMRIENELLNFSFLLLKEDAYFHKEALAKTSIAQLLKVQQKLFLLTNDFEKKIQSLVDRAFQVIEENGISNDDFHYKAGGMVGYFIGLREKGIAYDNAKGGKRQNEIFESGKWWSSKNPSADMLSVQAVLGQLFVELTTMFNVEYKEVMLAKLIRENVFPFMLLQAINDLLQHYKLENQLMLIGEFQQLVFGEVTGQPVPVIFERVGARYENIMIDEFQDTSVMQWHNLLPLIDNAVSNMNECLIVGDAKQAIYRFRGGEVKQFAMLPQIYGSDKDWVLKEREINIANHKPRLINLEHNYRSRNNIIAFNNEFYDVVKQLPKLSDKEVYNGHEQKPGKNIAGGNVHLSFIEKTDEQSLTEVMLHKVLDIVNAALAKGFSKRDIAIIVEKNKIGASIASYLISKEFDVVSPESLFIAEAPSVQLLECALRYLNRPEDLIARAELWYLLEEKFADKTAIGDINVHGYNSEFEARIATLICKEFDTQILRQQNLFQTVNLLIQLFDLDSISDPFVQFFLDEVLFYVHRFTGSIQHFLEWWEKEKEKKSIIYPETLDAIRVMTIHKSKGLEFPVVILPDANYKIQLLKGNHSWATIQKPYIEELSDFILPLKKSLLETDFAFLYEDEMRALFLDKLNMFYVATTRPTEMLYVVSELPSTTSKKELEVNSINKLLYHFLVETNRWSNTVTDYSIFDDDTTKQIFKKRKDSNLFEIKGAATQAAMSQVAVRTNQRQFWKKEKLDDIEYGNLLHEALARVVYAATSAQVISDFVSAEVDSETLRNRVAADANAVIQHSALSRFFNLPYKVYAEKPLLLKGKIKYPDRVMLNPENNSIVIIEYKTGKPETAHKEQVNEYAEAFTRLGFIVEKQMIVYTAEMKIEEL